MLSAVDEIVEDECYGLRLDFKSRAEQMIRIERVSFQTRSGE
jgi:hypothetical protein